MLSGFIYLFYLLLCINITGVMSRHANDGVFLAVCNSRSAVLCFYVYCNPAIKAAHTGSIFHPIRATFLVQTMCERLFDPQSDRSTGCGSKSTDSAHRAANWPHFFSECEPPRPRSNAKLASAPRTQSLPSRPTLRTLPTSKVGMGIPWKIWLFRFLLTIDE